jgi:hypothetical protein
MSDPLERVLKLVAEGRLTAEEAAPILDALDSRTRESASAAPGEARSARGAGADTGAGFAAGMATGLAGGTTDTNGGKPARWARIEVREHGKRVVDLRIPISLGRFALGRVPGLSKEHIADVEDAVSSGTRGPILDIEDDDGDGVRIVLE